jgi:zona occludens toxin
MINLLIGPPGGGKSYEAVVFHILPALAKGRKVITNLPLDLERIALIDPAYLDLIEIRTSTKAVEPEKDWKKAESLYQKFGIAAKAEFFVNRPFAHPEDYGDGWRHADSGSGPLYVIDECHLALPSRGTKISVEEWFSLHRHESADVLLITQSYGKVSRSIIELVQVCYRVKKGTAFGTSNNYIRKVQDGVRGEVVNTSVRKYEKRYFGLYKSHTRGGGAELQAEDITPIWKRWPFIGAAIFLPLAVVLFASTGATNILSPKVVAPPVAASTLTPVSVTKISQGETETKSDQVKPEIVPEGHPYSGRTLHIVGMIQSHSKKLYQFMVAQNGQAVSEVSSDELVQLGYVLDMVTPCGVKLSRDKWSGWVICDAPQVGTTSSEGVGTGSRSSKAAA